MDTKLNVNQTLHRYNLISEVFSYNETTDVVTPLGLARDILSKIPAGGKILVPGAGVGTFAVAAILEGHNPESITCLEVEPSYGLLGSRFLTPLGVTYLNQDYLTWHPDMQFDVIIGNPPYQDANNKARDQKLWMKFVDKSFALLADGGYLAMVTPRTIVGATKIPAKFRDRFTSDFSLDSVNHTSGDYFKVGVDICHWFARKVPYSGVTKVTDANGSREIDLREELPIPSDKVSTQALAEKIYAIIKSGSVPVLPAKLPEDDFSASGEGGYKTYMSGRNKFIFSDRQSSDYGKWKIAFSYSATYKQWFVTKDNVGGSHRVVLVDSPEAGVEIGNTLLTPLVQFYLDTWRKTSGYTPAIKNQGCLPDLRNLSEEQVSNMFELTDSEQAIIEGHYTQYKQIPRILP
jgi:predicted RNA methylase